jgi:hypothetical protein
MSDEERGRVKIRVNGEVWTNIHAPGMDPPTEIERRGLDELRVKYECEEDEIELIANDPLYKDSARTEYWEARREYDTKRRYPRKMVLEFNRPGTRKANMKPKEGE